MPPGQSVTTGKEEFNAVLNERMKPYLEEGHENQANAYFFGTFSGGGFLGVDVKDPDDVDAFIDLLNGEILVGFPDTMASGMTMEVVSVEKRLKTG